MSGRRPGRPPAGGADTRERILDAASALFASGGFDGTSTRTVATAAGVNVATLAWHFGDKQGLYEAVVARVYERLLAVELALDTLPPGSGPRVRVLVDRLYRVARAHRDEIRMLLRHVLDTSRLPAPAREKWLPQVLARVAEAVAALELPPGDHRLALLSVNHLVARYAVSDAEDLLLFVGPGDPDDAVAAHLGEAACRLLGVS